MTDQDIKESSSLGEAISAAIAAKITPEFIEEKIAQRAEKVIDEAIRDAMSYYGHIGNQIRDAVKDSLQVNNLDLPSYGHIVTSVLQAQIEATVAPLIEGKLKEDMEQLLKLAPKSIKLSEIVESMMEQNEDIQHGEVCTCIVENREHGSAWIYLDEGVIEDFSAGGYARGTRDKKHQCDVRILLSDDGTIFSASFRGTDMKTMRMVGVGGYGLEQRIRAYHACGTIIEVDEDHVITSRGDY